MEVARKLCYNLLEVNPMEEKERYLKFIKNFSNINLSKYEKELNLSHGSFYVEKFSIETMQKLTNAMRNDIKKIYIDIDDNDFILNTKEKNVEFVKDLKNIGINHICKNLKIATSALYQYKCSEKRYKQVVEEIKKQLDEMYKKYNKNT